MAKMKFRATIELDYYQMAELLYIVLAVQKTTDRKLDSSFILHGDYGTYTYKTDKKGNVLVLKVKEIENEED